MRYIRRFWWLLNPSMNIRVYYRSWYHPFGDKIFDQCILTTCYNRCTPNEQQFLRDIRAWVPT